MPGRRSVKEPSTLDPAPSYVRHLQNVSFLSPHVDPLTYVLLFPDGLMGWHDGLKHRADQRTNTNQRLTSGQFYAHRLMVFDPENPLPHGAGMLFQQYVVDAYCRAEAQRLNYLRIGGES